MCSSDLFNKSVQQEAQRRFPYNTQSSTVHSLAYQAVGTSFVRAGISIGSSVGYKPIRIQFRVGIQAAALIRETLQNYLVSADREIGPEHVMLRPNMRVPSSNPEEFLADRARQLWTTMKTSGSRFIPITHDGYLKLFQLSRPKLDCAFILYDEAQDTNPVSTDIVMQQVEAGASALFCGDPYQQIYSWRGAVNSLAQIDGPTKFLTRSFRFSNNVADYANALLEMYFKPEFKLKGVSANPDQVVLHEGVSPGMTDTAMLFRTNARMFEKMFELAEKDVSFFFCGDLASTLDFVLDVFYLKMNTKAMISAKSKVKGFDTYSELCEVAEIDAELSSMRKIVEEHKGKIPEIVGRIRESQAQYANHADVSVSSIHKAKGLEWDTVVISDDICDMMLRDKMLPLMPDAPNHVREVIRNPEEINLLYVAMTRAKKRLELPSKCFGLKECFDANKETGDFFHVPDLRPRNQDRGRFQEQPEDPDFD